MILPVRQHFGVQPRVLQTPFLANNASHTRVHLQFAADQLQLPDRQPVVAALRENHLECIWDASAVVATASGKVLAHFGNDTRFPIIARSSIKPLHAAMLLDAMTEAKAQGKAVPELTPAEWAVLCASHAGSDAHVTQVQQVLDQFNLSKDNLVTGTHPPLDAAIQERLIREGKQPNVLQHQCSGHHTALNALAQLKGFPVADYSNPDGALQQFSLQTLKADSGDEAVKLVKSDGCNIPTWAVPMASYAKLFARLVDGTRYQAVVEGMTRHPDLVGDDKRIDGWLMKASQGRLIAKMGNDGLICVARKPAEGEEAQAMVFKLWQGNGNADPMRDRVVIQALADLGWLNPAEVDTLRSQPQFALVEYNNGGAVKGQRKVEYKLFNLPWQRPGEGVPPQAETMSAETQALPGKVLARALFILKTVLLRCLKLLNLTPPQGAAKAGA